MSVIKNALRTFFYEKLDQESKVMYLLTGIIFALGAALLIINYFTYDFQGTEYFSSPWQRVTLPLLLLSGFTIYFKDIISKRLYLVIYTLAIYCLSLSAGLLLTQGIQLTPFPTIDHWLVHADNTLGFNQLALIKFVSTHNWLKETFIDGYNSLIPELTILPLLMAVLLCERRVKVFLFAMLLTYPVGTMIFYFFPTTAPASVMHSVYFTFQEHDTFIKFYQMHHHLKVTTDMGGLIAFPSFHVIWAVLLIYLVRDKKWLFFPVLLWNLVLIGSTVCLGWHYLLDVIAGITIGSGCIYASERIYNKVNYLTTRKCGRSVFGGLSSGSEGGVSPPPSVSSSLKTMPRPFSYE